MKKIILVLSFISSMLVFSQEELSHRGFVNIQLFGPGIGYEYAVNNNFAAQLKYSYQYGFYGSGTLSDAEFVATSYFTLEPRWYYNREKREEKGKSLTNNSGNYFSLQSVYLPDLWTSSSEDNVSVVPTLRIIPTWGLRRDLGNQFGFEFRTGLGYEFFFEDNFDDGLYLDLNVSLDFSF